MRRLIPGSQEAITHLYPPPPHDSSSRRLKGIGKSSLN